MSQHSQIQFQPSSEGVQPQRHAPLRLIHCADFHLDSPLGTRLSPEKVSQRRQELMQAFSRMVSFGQEHGVSLILIAGDLWDSEQIATKTREMLLDVIQHAPDIDFLYVPGNHDGSASPSMGFVPSDCCPKNFKQFPDQWTTYHYGNVDITGIQLTSENCTHCYESLMLDSNQVNLVMLHGQIGSVAGPDQIPLRQLQHKGIDYLALGHLHSYQEGPLDSRGIFCYSGCPEGRGFDECGPKGFVLLEIQGQHLDHVFVPHAKRRIHRIPVEISDCETFPAMVRKLRETGAEIPSSDLVRFTLTGDCPSHVTVDIQGLTQEVAPLYFYGEVKDESRLLVHPEEYENDLSLKGEFLRRVLGSSLSEKDQEAVIRMGLGALRGEEIVR